MDTNKMRDDLPSLVKQSIESHPGYGEFAAWCESEQIHPYPIYFLIWQASREAVVVALPDDGIEDCRKEIGERCKDTFDCGYNFASLQHERAIEAQGLKVAP